MTQMSYQKEVVDSMVNKIGRMSVLAAVSVLIPGALFAGGGSSGASIPDAPAPQLSAKDYYQRGLKARDKAWALEEKAAGLSGAAAEKALKKMRKQFEAAVSAQQQAVALEPRAHQAYSSLGYALRRLGRFDESLAAYNRALAIDPTYAEAIEYRGEAYLGLGRLEDAKQAYMALFRSDPEQAGKLLEAMQTYVEEQRASAGSQELEDFASWVAERGELAAQVSMLSTGEKWDS